MSPVGSRYCAMKARLCQLRDKVVSECAASLQYGERLSDGNCVLVKVCHPSVST